MNSFDRLDPLVQHHIVNSLGWRSLRPLQERSIDPILDGKHCLLLAPTAGGKTEAALFPVFSRMVSGKWHGLTILYVCPLKALLNNLQQRLEHYAGLFGRRCDVWHGDISSSRKEEVRRSPPDILLTTPESLEGILVSRNPQGREILRTLEMVVVDEIHAFAGDDRGWHLLAVLERVTRLTGRELQRIGLSATVGNPDQLLGWLSGHCAGEREVVFPQPNVTAPPEVSLDYVGSLENAALVIARLHRGEKRLVFCDSRSQVEQLAGHLRERGIETFLSHSSLSIDERRTAERAFSESRNCVIVATSTLELGIDVGDLDRVIQIDAPNTVASFLQRLGRTGRRSGSSRNCLFLATTERALLKAAALLELWSQGFVEPVAPPPKPLHIFSQQLMALSLQLSGLGVRDWIEWIGRLPPFAALGAQETQEIIEFLKEQNILFEESGRLSFATEGEALFGRRHFLELLSVFSTPSMLTVVAGMRELGLIEAAYLIRPQDGTLPVIALAGRSWAVLEIDWRAKRVHVEPASVRGRGAWIGSGQELPAHVALAIKQVLASQDTSAHWSTRASDALQRIREEFSFLKPDRHTLHVSASGAADWYTFAGGAINSLISGYLARAHGLHCQSRDLAISFPVGTSLEQLTSLFPRLEAQAIAGTAVFDSSAVEALKFHQCLPPQAQHKVLSSRCCDMELLASMILNPTAIVIGAG